MNMSVISSTCARVVVTSAQWTEYMSRFTFPGRNRGIKGFVAVKVSTHCILVSADRNLLTLTRKMEHKRSSLECKRFLTIPG
jgi:hypothetical protein